MRTFVMNTTSYKIQKLFGLPAAGIAPEMRETTIIFVIRLPTHWLTTFCSQKLN